MAAPWGLSTIGVDAEPSEATFSLVVVASAGRDLLDAPAFRVNWIEELRCCFGKSWREIEEEDMVLLDATLSQATSVTGAALDETRDTDDNEPRYRF